MYTRRGEKYVRARTPYLVSRITPHRLIVFLSVFLSLPGLRET